MEIYISVFIVLALMTMCNNLVKSKIWLIIATIILIVFAGLRNNVGYDYLTYSNIYSGNLLQGQVELGFLKITEWLHSMGVPFSIFTILWSAGTIGLLAIFVNKYMPSDMSPLLYYYARFFLVRDMGQIRSSMAAVICMLSIKSIIDHKFWKFLLIVIIASTIHISALFFLLCYPLVQFLRQRYSLKREILSIILSMLFGIALSGIMVQTVMKFFPRYYAYVYSSAYLSTSIINPVAIMQLLILLLSTWITFSSKRSCENIVDGSLSSAGIDVLLAIYWISTILLFMFPTFSTVVGRLSTIGATVEIILVPTIINRLVGRFGRSIVLIIVSGIVFYLIFVVSGAYQYYVPYVSIFA
ncbi:EpsG family protein [Lacticaseibacillus zhaodongensis]|uniref:EpsG family protein n=1 Tax=Lacticaseibacillus zhaodongensis TaxID=2668065 RepID=UPI0012D2A31D|nr:EpsG family protein [Lacticaseibacillus zhaodongensis]